MTIGGTILVLIVLLILYIFLRDSPKNNLRRARKYHKRAQKYHARGDEEEAQAHYLMANEYRERALEGEQ